ncbi:MAG: hypothetical protein HQ581_02535 [Planctomycetes bacterium]|nr:hypothetical protein [Planctomycetota bacterium]
MEKQPQQKLPNDPSPHDTVEKIAAFCNEIAQNYAVYQDDDEAVLVAAKGAIKHAIRSIVEAGLPPIPNPPRNPCTVTEALDALGRIALWCGSPADSPGKKRKRRSAAKTNPLTPIQVKTVQVVGECEGDVAKAAKRLGKDRSTVQESYTAAMSKLGKSAVKHKTRSMPRDKRGQEHLSEGDDRRKS